MLAQFPPWSHWRGPSNLRLVFNQLDLSDYTPRVKHRLLTTLSGASARRATWGGATRSTGGGQCVHPHTSPVLLTDAIQQTLSIFTNHTGAIPHPDLQLKLNLFLHHIRTHSHRGRKVGFTIVHLGFLPRYPGD